MAKKVHAKAADAKAALAVALPQGAEATTVPIANILASTPQAECLVHRF